MDLLLERDITNFICIRGCNNQGKTKFCQRKSTERPGHLGQINPKWNYLGTTCLMQTKDSVWAQEPRTPIMGVEMSQFWACLAPAVPGQLIITWSTMNSLFYQMVLEENWNWSRYWPYNMIKTKNISVIPPRNGSKGRYCEF